MDAPMVENVISTFRSEFLKEDKQISDFSCLLGISEENKLLAIQKKGSLQEIISHVHGCLNTSKHRAEGLIFLEQLLDQSVTEVFTENAAIWIRFIIQCLESHDDPEVKKVGSHIGGKILPLTVNFTALSKEVTSILSQLLTVLLSAESEWLPEALKLINVCIQSYPGPCGTFKGKIEAKLLELFVEDIVPVPAITTYVLLAGCGGGGTKGIKHTEAWSNKCQQILSSLNKVLDHLYEGLNITDTETQYDTPPLPTKDFPESPVGRYSQLVTYHNTYSQCLQELISQPFSAPVKIPIDDILQTIYKTLSVTSKSLHKRPSTERLILSGHVSAVHKEAILSLQVLVSRCKTLLLPYAKSIVSLLVQELVWSRVPVAYGQTRAYNSLRETVYETLSLWLQTTQSFTETTSEGDWLVQEILHDSRPHTDSMKVESTKGKNVFEPPPAKKKKKGGYSELSHGISSQRKIDVMANSELCVEALEALYCLLTTVGCHLKQKTIQEIQEFIVSVGKTFRSKGNYGIPYNCDRCRHRLLMVMQAFNLMPHPSASSILQYSLSILRSTVQDNSLLVSSFSIESLQVCESLIHARAPCFHKPKIVQREVIQDAPEENKQNSSVIRETSSFLDQNRKKSLFESEMLSSSRNSERDLIKPGKLFSDDKMTETSTLSQVQNSNKISDKRKTENLNNSSKTEVKDLSPISLGNRDSKLQPKSSIDTQLTILKDDDSISNEQERPHVNMSTEQTENECIKMDTDDSEEEPDVIQTPGIDSTQDTEMDPGSSIQDADPGPSTLILKEDQEDLDDILSSFVDTDKD